MTADAGPRSAASNLGPHRAWSMLLHIVERIRSVGPIVEPIGVQLDAADRLVEIAPSLGTLVLDPGADRGWSMPPGPTDLLPDATVDLFDLFMPLCVGPGCDSMVVAHLAQSLDGRVATHSGSSQFISGREDLTHTHRLRALFDAVLVGARTVEHDDPRLTTRLAEGPNPTRVIVDPGGRLPDSHRVFTQGDAATLVIRGTKAPTFVAPSHVEVATLELADGWIPVPQLLDALSHHGLRRVFIEGGGITVSGFIRARAVDRLHITVAPVLMGSGRPSISLPEIETLDEAMRVQCRHFTLGPDLLFDCPLPRLGQ